MIKACENCKVEFETKNKRTRFCSISCSNSFNRNGITIKQSKLKNLDIKQLEQLIEQGLSAVKIGQQLNLSSTTVIKYTGNLLGEKYANQLFLNGREAKKTQYKDGRASYAKFKKDYCERCGARDKKLEVHHIIPAQYDEKWAIKEGDHSEGNLKTLCNRCHQVIHYRELGRKPAIQGDKK